jgi:hypothetical protein
MALFEITRTRADIASSRAEWEARSQALRASQTGRGGQPALPAVPPRSQAYAERLETPPTARRSVAAPARKWLIPWAK